MHEFKDQLRQCFLALYPIWAFCCTIIDAFLASSGHLVTAFFFPSGVVYGTNGSWTMNETGIGIVVGV
jgi:hypothetical protein